MFHLFNNPEETAKDDRSFPVFKLTYFKPFNNFTFFFGFVQILFKSFNYETTDPLEIESCQLHTSDALLYLHYTRRKVNLRMKMGDSTATNI